MQKANKIIIMVKKLKLLTFFEKLMAGIALFTATGLLTEGAIIWRTVAIHENRLDTQDTKFNGIYQRLDGIEQSTVSYREFVRTMDGLKEHIDTRFNDLKDNKK